MIALLFWIMIVAYAWVMIAIVGAVWWERHFPTDEVIELAASGADRFGPLLGQSLAMRELFVQLERLAQGESTVLVTGESGTGKTALATKLILSLLVLPVL